MNKEQFDAACVAAFGTNYTSDIAREMNVTSRTVRYWREGTRTIPDSITEEFIGLLNKRSLSAKHAVDKLRALTFKDMLAKDIAATDNKYNSYNDKRGETAFLRKSVINDKFMDLAKKFDDSDSCKTAIATICEQKAKLKANEIDSKQLDNSTRAAREELATIIEKSCTARQSIALAFDLPYEEIFEQFVFDPAPDFFAHVKLPMHNIVFTEKQVNNSYRVSKKGKSALEIFDSNGAPVDNGKIISVKLSNDEIVWISIDEFTEYNQTECPVDALNY